MNRKRSRLILMQTRLFRSICHLRKPRLLVRQKQVVPRNLAPSIRAEAPAHESKEPQLMECMSEGCRVMCSPTMQSKPRWCSYFKEPADPTQKNAATKL